MLYIEFARRQRHWSQDALGKLTRIPQAFISLMELGRGMPTGEQRQRLAVALDLPPELILKTIECVVETQATSEAVQR